MVRVLVVDDELSLRTNIAAYLEDEDMEASTAASAEDAIEMAEAGEQFDVCIMDIRLPGISGLRAIPLLHAVQSGLRFIIHTGTAGYALTDDLRQIGMDPDDIFMKPMTSMAPLADRIRLLAKQGDDQH